MSLSLEEIINDTLAAYDDQFTTKQIVDALRSLADTFEEDEQR